MVKRKGIFYKRSYGAKKRRYNGNGRFTITARRRGYGRTGGYYGRYTGNNAEKKFHDVDILDAVTVVPMVIHNLTVIPEGNGESERIGRKICIKSISWKFEATLPTTAIAANTSDLLKFFIVQDRQTNGAQFAATDLLDLDAWDSFNNLANSKRFKVLMTKTITLRAHAGSGRGTTDTLSYGEDIRYSIGSKQCSIEIEYDNSANTGAIGTVRSNNIYWCTQTTRGLPAIVGHVRVRYTDR